MKEIIFIEIPNELNEELQSLKENLHYNWSLLFDYLLSKHQPLDDVYYGYNPKFKSSKKWIIHISVESYIWVKWRKFSAAFKNQCYALDYLISLEKNTFSSNLII